MGAEHFVIDKFGGSSVETAGMLRQSAQRVKTQLAEGMRVVAVPSAISGATNMLHSAIDLAVTNGNYQTVIEDFGERQREVNEALTSGVTGVLQADLSLQTDRAIQTLDMIRMTGGATPAQKDELISLGERVNAKTFAAYLDEAGMNAINVDAIDVLATDNKFGDANPDIGLTRDNFRKVVLGHLFEGAVAVIGGYHGSTVVDGKRAITTTGRGGSDFSATVFAEAAKGLLPEETEIEVVLWKADFGGIYTADPRIVTEALLIPRMNFQEAAALSGIGGSMLHPKAIDPVRRANIPLFLKDTLDPEKPGTVVDGSQHDDGVPIKAVSCLRNLLKLTVEGSGMHQPNIAGRVTSALGSIQEDIRFIAQPISESTMIFGLESREDMGAIGIAVSEALAEQIASRDIDEKTLLVEKVAAIAIIGHGVRYPASKELFYGGLRGTHEYPVDPLPGDSSSGSHEASTLIKDSDDNTYNALNAVHNAVFSSLPTS